MERPPTAQGQALPYSAFISYAIENQREAEAIRDALQQRGLPCWMAPHSIKPGRLFPVKIAQGIKQSRCLVLLLSEASNGKDNVLREVERAVNYRKMVIPYRLEKVTPSERLEFFASLPQWANSWEPGAIDKLADAIATADEPDGDFSAPLQIARRWQRSPVVAAVAAVVLASSIAVAWWLLFGRTSSMPMPSSPAPAPVLPPAKSPEDVSAGDIRIKVRNLWEKGASLLVQIDDRATQALLRDATLYYSLDSRPEVEADNPRRVDIRDFGAQPPQRLSLRYQMRDGTDIGPFSYPLELGKKLTAQTLNTINHDDDNPPLFCSGQFCTINLSEQIAAGLVTAIELGEKASDLALRYTVYRDRDGKPQLLHALPIRAGTREIFYRVLMADGSASDIVRAEVSSPSPSGRTLSSGNATAPAVFAHYNGSAWAITAALSQPIERFDFAPDTGGFFSRPAEGQAMTIEAPVSGDHIRLRFHLADGSTIGPFSYAIDYPDIAKAALSDYFDPANVLFCMRFLKTQHGTHAGTPYGYLKESAVVCEISNWQQFHAVVRMEYGAHHDQLAQVREFQPQDELIRKGLQLDPKAPGTFGSDDRSAADAYWRATLPVSTEAFYARFELYDGRRTDVIRYAVTGSPINLP